MSVRTGFTASFFRHLRTGGSTGTGPYAMMADDPRVGGVTLYLSLDEVWAGPQELVAIAL